MIIVIIIFQYVSTAPSSRLHLATINMIIESSLIIYTGKNIEMAADTPFHNISQVLALTCVHVTVDIDRFASEGDRVSALSRRTVIVKEIVDRNSTARCLSKSKLVGAGRGWPCEENIVINISLIRSSFNGN